MVTFMTLGYVEDGADNFLLFTEGEDTALVMEELKSKFSDNENFTFGVWRVQFPVEFTWEILNFIGEVAFS